MRVLGGIKLLYLGVAHTKAPDWFRVGPPNDFVSGTSAVKFLGDGRQFHVPDRKWAELRSDPLLKKWFTL